MYILHEYIWCVLTVVSSEVWLSDLMWENWMLCGSALRVVWKRGKATGQTLQPSAAKIYTSSIAVQIE